MGLDGGWGLGVTKHFKHNMASKRTQGKRSRFDVGTTDVESDTDSDNELFLTSENWPRLLLMKSASEERALNRLSPFAMQKGFQAIAGTLKSIRRLRDGSFLVECNRRT